MRMQYSLLVLTDTVELGLSRRAFLSRRLVACPVRAYTAIELGHCETLN